MYTSVLEQIARTLGAAAIPYMVIGGQAVLLYGEPRLTKDVDVTLGVDLDGLAEILLLIEQMQFDLLVDPETFTRQTMVLPCQDPGTGVRVDFIFSFSAFEREALRRVNGVLINDTEVCFASIEDLIIHKMVAGRPRDLEDVKSVLNRNPDIDLPYLRHWLQAFSADLGYALLDQFEQIRPA